MSLSSSVQLVRITDDAGAIVAADWLARAQRVHRQLRPMLPPDYEARMRDVFASGGEMLVAAVGHEVRGVAVFRMHERTHCGRELYCDDLVTDEAHRSAGVGDAMIAAMEAIGIGRKADVFTLDSGTQRQQAHKFYFREGMVVSSFHFEKSLKT